MHTLRRAVLALLIGVAPASALAEVKVNFVNPEKFTDASFPGGRDRERTLGQIEKVFQNLGEQHLPAGQTLTIDVLDVDLAGWFQPWSFQNYEVRFVRDFTWPRMKLRYSLEGAGQEPLRGEETISDRGFLMVPNPVSTNLSLRHEKPMMERWFVSRIVKQNPAP
jgi:hypothetical protein